MQNLMHLLLSQIAERTLKFNIFLALAEKKLKVAKGKGASGIFAQIWKPWQHEIRSFFTLSDSYIEEKMLRI